MKTPVHTCAAQGCQHQIPQHLLMCMDHWRMVPVKLRRPVLATYKAMRHPPESFSEGDWQTRLDARTDYLHAVANAVAALADKQIHKLEERKAVEGDLFTISTK